MVLAPERPSRPAIRSEHGVLFLRHPDRLTAPLGDRGRRLELDRVLHLRDDPCIPLPRHSPLTIPEADGRTGTMSVLADRM